MGMLTRYISVNELESRTCPKAVSGIIVLRECDWCGIHPSVALRKGIGV